MNTYSLCEAVADLAMMFATPRYAPHLPDDSRETIRLVIEWAHDFEALNKDREWDGEYMEEIEAYFHQRYDQWSN